MRKNRRVQKNIESNIKSYDQKPITTDHVLIKVTLFFVVLILVIAIPLMSIFAGANVAFRVSDVFKFDFNNSQAASALELDMTSEELGSVFADFMMHKTDKFELTASVDGTLTSVYSPEDSELMMHFRGLVDASLVAMGILFLLLTIITIYMIVKKEYKLLRRGYNISAILYFLLIGGVASVAFMPTIRAQVLDALLGQTVSPDSALLKTFSTSYPMETGLVVVAVSLVLMVIIRSIFWRFSIKDRMFD